jgi:hypothetical protein
VVFHHGSAETTTAGSISVQLAKLATRNDVLILTCADTRHGLESGAVSGAGVTWNQAVNTAAESNMEIWYGIVVEPSMADVRIDSTLPKQGDPSFSIRMDLTEWSGLAVDQTSIVDVAIANSGEDKISTDTASPMQITTTYPIDVLVLGVSASSPATFDEPTQGPWSTIGIVDASPNALDSSWYRIVPMRTIANPMVALTTSSGGTMWAAAIAAFKVAP